jgi:prepilin peptidase CpaA
MTNWLPDPLPSGLYGLALATALAAAYYDFRWRKIPNWLILPALVLGLAANLWLRGLPGLALSLGGFLFAAAIYFPIYLLKGIGAGDVKLMMAIATITGPRQWLLILLFTSIFAVFAGLVAAHSKSRVGSVLYNTGLLLKELAMFRVPHKRHEQLDLHHPAAIRNPHGVSAAAGTVLFVLLMMFSR